MSVYSELDFKNISPCNEGKKCQSLYIHWPGPTNSDSSHRVIVFIVIGKRNVAVDEGLPMTRRVANTTIPRFAHCSIKISSTTSLYMAKFCG